MRYFSTGNSPDKITLLSYAKINLGLVLLNKRDDGYHNIATIFQQIDLHDHLTFCRISSATQITTNNPDLPVDETNLVYRAIQLFKDHLGIRDNLMVHIDKKIPMGAGLGGGSSNAAATLRAANQIWNVKLSEKELKLMALELGSDVPFFLIGGTALGEGRGEILTPLPMLPKCWILLVCPNIHVSTAWAYNEAKITLTKDEKLIKFRSIFHRYDFHALQETLVNEFEGVVFSRHPVLEGIKEQMVKRDAFYASMSGSGSTIYGFFKNRGIAERANTFFYKQGLRTFLCRPVNSPLTE